jgi:5'-nucleotidase
MKRYILLICLMLSIGIAAQTYKQITVLHTNDTHSRIEPFMLADSSLVGGYVRRATYVATMRDTIKNILLFDCGDFSQGSPYYNMFKGTVEISLMNNIGYDATAIGNHEFDFGIDNMVRIFKLAKFPVVCANYDFGTTPLAKIVKPYVVLQRFGLRIGVFGLSPRLAGLVQEKNYKGITYLDPVICANHIAKILKEKEKCDIVICLSHLGWDSSEDDSDCDPRLIHLTRNIDMVLGGHSHTLFKEPIWYKNLDNKLIPNTQMGARGIYVGRIDIKLEKK